VRRGCDKQGAPHRSGVPRADSEVKGAHQRHTSPLVDTVRDLDIPLLVRQTYQLMVVCHCNVVSDHEIRAAVAAGVLDAEGLASACNAGTKCGGCRSIVDAIVAETSVTIVSAA